MAVIPAEKKVESSHWYHANGDSCHQVQQKNGKMRNTNLVDARKFGLFPSVTGILGVFAKPQLDTWKQKEVAKASLRIVQSENESEDSYANRVIDAAFEQVDEAADFGTRVHQAIEDWIVLGKAWGKEFEVYLRPVADWFEKTKILVTASELRLVNVRIGYAGTMDISFAFGPLADQALIAIKAGDQRTTLDLWKAGLGIGVLDFKTKKTKPEVAVTAFPFQDMQIAAYGGTYWSQTIGVPEEEVLSRMIGANLYISSTEPGRFDVVKYPAEQLLGCWLPFTQACEIWRYIKKYDPRGALEALGKVIEEEKPSTDDVQEIFDKVEEEKAKKKAKPEATKEKTARPPKDEKEATPPKKTAKEEKREKALANFEKNFRFQSGKYKSKSLNEADPDYLKLIATAKTYAKMRAEFPELEEIIPSIIKAK